MKRLSIIIALAAALLAGGKANAQQFKTITVSDKLCFMSYDDEDFFEDVDSIGVRDSFSIVWPAKGMMTEKAMKELMTYYFHNESGSTDIQRAARNWREQVLNEYGGNRVDNINEQFPYSEHSMSSTCEQHGKLATFIIHYYNYEVGAAHGLYAEQDVVVDVKTGKIIPLHDLIDTSNLGRIVARAVQDLVVNSDVQTNLFDEYKEADELPVSTNFFIDSTLSVIYVVYDLYHIAPYCYGLQTIALPVYWLSKYTTLTPYAKRLFGPDSYIRK